MDVISTIEDSVSKRFERMLKNPNLVRGFLNRVAYPMIIRFQRERWQSENATEGAPWDALDPLYARSKLKRFAIYPGGGRKMLIATSRLVKGVVGDVAADHYKLVEEKRLYVGTSVPYAKWVNKQRNFTRFGNESISKIRDELKKYIASQP